MKGNAEGAGFLIGAVCDFMVCSKESSYSYNSTGQYPTIPEQELLQERFGELQAQDWLQGGSATGKQLIQKGWSCAIVPQDQVDSQVQELAATLAQMPQQSLLQLKQHMSRNIRPLVQQLTVNHTREQQSTEKDILLVTIDSNTSSLELETTFTQSSQYQAIVISSTHPQFFPMDLQSLLLDSKVPIIAALGAGTANIAWLTSLLCDTCVYNKDGAYSYQLPHQEAVELFSSHFGHYLAKEIILTGTEYQGSQLQQKAKTTTAVAAEQVLPTALQLAKSWKKPRSQKHSFVIKNTEQIQEQSTLPSQHGTKIPLNSTTVNAIAYPSGIVAVTMEDRQGKNLFTKSFMAAMMEVFLHINQHPDYKVVVLTGYDSYFSTGGSREALEAIQDGSAKYSDAPIYELALRCPIPVVAAMQGHGIGAGWTMGMFCDLILFSEESIYSTRFMGIGFTPGAGSTLLFPHQLGMDLSREVLFTALEYKGVDLKQRGVVIPVLPRKQIQEAAMVLAQKIAQVPRATLVAVKQKFNQAINEQLPQVYQLEIAMQEKTFVNNEQILLNIQQNFNQETQQVVAPAIEETSSMSSEKNIKR